MLHGSLMRVLTLVYKMKIRILDIKVPNACGTEYEQNPVVITQLFILSEGYQHDLIL